ncbi:anaerobic ribonucleoside-triphosphate reductase activating protein [Persicirhabdus sediminis]|nr:anaerobic ribonucleoside-triphosphate reductase activating protein [Persicirhabdus sediminis]
MNFSYPQIVMQEIPGEITLALSISGCPLKCPGCHSAFTWDGNFGQKLNKSSLIQLLDKYEGLLSCVLFYGGEWEADTLLDLLAIVRERGMLTALFSGLESLPESITSQLDFVKLGPWKRELGGLDSAITNQRLYDLRSGECLNHHFVKKDSSVELTF